MVAVVSTLPQPITEEMIPHLATLQPDAKGKRRAKSKPNVKRRK
jgi:hypothetical protein